MAFCILPPHGGGECLKISPWRTWYGPLVGWLDWWQAYAWEFKGLVGKPCGLRVRDCLWSQTKPQIRLPADQRPCKRKQAWGEPRSCLGAGGEWGDHSRREAGPALIGAWGEGSAGLTKAPQRSQEHHLWDSPLWTLAEFQHPSMPLTFFPPMTELWLVGLGEVDTPRSKTEKIAVTPLPFPFQACLLPTTVSLMTEREAEI